MNYVDDVDYLRARFGSGQLEIINRETGTTARGAIKSFNLTGALFEIEVEWLCETTVQDPELTDWARSNRGLKFEFDMKEWDDSCHGEGRIGLKNTFSDEVFRIVPSHHSSHIKRPPAVQ